MKCSKCEKEVTEENFGEGYYEDGVLKEVTCEDCSFKDIMRLMKILEEE